jgi:hypothetical protein
MPRRLFLTLLLAGAACAGRPAAPSRAAALAGRAAAALGGDDPRAVWDLLGSTARAGQSYEAFAARWKATRAERERRAAALERMLREGEQVGERGRVTPEGGPPAELVLEPGGWRLDTPLVATLRAATPADALRLLAGAVDDRNVAALFRVLTSARRDDVRRALDRFTGGLRAHLADSIDVTGDRATLVWHDGEHRYRVTLKRENGEWRIDDFGQQ